MGYQRERDEFIATMARLGMSADTARLVLRHATTHHRLSERECNGTDWEIGALLPCPMRAKQDSVMTCIVCGKGSGKGMHERVTKSSVRMEQIEARITKLVSEALQVAPYVGATPVARFAADFQGDPRGYTVRIRVTPLFGESDRYRQGIGVPVRGC